MKNSSHHFRRLLSLTAAVTVPGLCAHAQWIGTTNNLSYDDTANWNGGVINDVFQGPYNWPSAPAVSNSNQFSFTAGSTSVTTGTVNAYGLSVGQSITGTGIPDGATIVAINSTNSITISVPTTGASTGNYTVAQLNSPWNVNLGATRTLTGGFTYQNTDPANVMFTPVATGTTWTFSSAKPTITLDMGATGISRSLQMGAASRPFIWNFQNADANFAINPSLPNIGQSASADTMVLYATLNGLSSLTKTGGGRLELYRTATVNGAVNVNGGILRLRSFADSVFGKIDGATEYNVVGQGVGLDLIISHATGNVLSSGKINLESGALAIGGSTSQTVGAVNLVGGRGVIASYSAADKILTLGSLTRENFSTINLVGNSQGGRSLGVGTLIKIAGDDSNILADLVGGGGAAGSTKISILPWATTTSANANELSPADTGLWSGADLVTYTTSGGFRALTASEYYAANGTNLLTGAAAQDNVKLSYSAAINTDLTVNAISVGASNLVQTIASDKTLTITSGVITTGSNTVTFAGGVLSSGNRELIVTGRSTVTISSSITNTISDQNKAGVIYANVGSGVLVDGVNSYGGMTVVQGIATFRNGGALPNATELRVDRSGRAIISNGITATVRKLSGNGSLEFQIANNANKLNVGTVLISANNTVTVGSGGTIAPGYESGDIGALTLGNNANNLTFQSGSVFQVDIGSALSFDSLQNTNTNGTNTLRIDGGTISLNFVNGYAPEVGSSWLLTSGFTATAGDAALMNVVDAAGYTYAVAFQNNNLLLTLTAVPEPSPALLALVGVGVMLHRFRRLRR